jgi:hypothetical protein
MAGPPTIFLREVYRPDCPGGAIIPGFQYNTAQLAHVPRPVTAHQLAHRGRFYTDSEPVPVPQDTLDDTWNIFSAIL